MASTTNLGWADDRLMEAFDLISKVRNDHPNNAAIKRVLDAALSAVEDADIALEETLA